jgi:hypothetical protein
MAGTLDVSEFIKAYEPEPEEIIEEEKVPKPFDFIKAINNKKDMLIDDPEVEKYYNAYIINRGFSYFIDTVLHANEMNMYPGIPASSQYYYYMNSIRKGNRFSKWYKHEKDDDQLMIQKLYNVRPEIAKQYMKLISEDDMARLREFVSTGETTPKKKRNK